MFHFFQGQDTRSSVAGGAPHAIYFHVGGLDLDPDAMAAHTKS